MKKSVKLITIIIITLQISSFSFSMPPGMRVALRAMNQTRCIKKLPVRFNSTQPTKKDNPHHLALAGLFIGTVGLSCGAAVGDKAVTIGSSIINKEGIKPMYAAEVGTVVGGMAGGLLASYAMAGPIGVAGWAIPTALIGIAFTLKQRPLSHY